MSSSSSHQNYPAPAEAPGVNHFYASGGPIGGSKAAGVRGSRGNEVAGNQFSSGVFCSGNECNPLTGTRSLTLPAPQPINNERHNSQKYQHDVIHGKLLADYRADCKRQDEIYGALDSRNFHKQTGNDKLPADKFPDPKQNMAHLSWVRENAYDHLVAERARQVANQAYDKMEKAKQG